MKAMDIANQFNSETILLNLPCAISWKTIDGTYLGCNELFAKIAGLSYHQDIIGKTDYDMPWYREADNLKLIDKTIVESNDINTSEHELRISNEHLITYQIIKKPLYDNNQNTIGIITTLVETSKSKITKNKSKQPIDDAFVDLEQVIACMPGIVYWKDINGFYRGCNNGMIKFLGYTSKNSVIGKSDFDIANDLNISKKVIESFCQADQTVIKTGISKINIEELPFPGAGGYIINQLTNKVPLYNNQNKIIGIVGISIDITDIKHNRQALMLAKEQAERKAKNALENLDQITACMPGSVYWKNVDGKYIGCNDAMAFMLGLTKEEVINKTDYDFAKILGWSKKTVDGITKTDKEVIKSGMPRLNVEEPPFNFADGKIINQLTNKVPLKDENGNVVGVLGISIDITELKRTQRELQETRLKLEGMTAVAASIAHELRTPLTSIYFGLADIKDTFLKLTSFYNKTIEKNHSIIDADLFKPNELNSQTNAFVSLNREVKAADIFIDMLLTNLSSPTDNLIYENFSIASTVNEALKRYPFQKDQEKLIYWNDKKEDFIIYGNQTLVIHILFNLIKNAIHYVTKSRAIKTDAKIEIWTKKGKKYNQLYFKDTGTGITPDVLPHIFDRFFSKTTHGAGIGLTFCKIAMESLGGKIECKSVEGEYTVFTLAFPHENMHNK